MKESLGVKLFSTLFCTAFDVIPHKNTKFLYHRRFRYEPSARNSKSSVDDNGVLHIPDGTAVTVSIRGGNKPKATTIDFLDESATYDKPPKGTIRVGNENTTTYAQATTIKLPKVGITYRYTPSEIAP